MSGFMHCIQCILTINYGLSKNQASDFGQGVLLQLGFSFGALKLNSGVGKRRGAHLDKYSARSAVRSEQRQGLAAYTHTQT